MIVACAEAGVPEPVVTVVDHTVKHEGNARLFWDPTQQALARGALDDTTEWRRDSPFLATAAAALGLSDEGLDGLFVSAAAIVL